MVERRAAEPVMPMMLFKNRNFNLTTIAGLLTGIAMFGAIGYMPTYLQMATGYSATEAGLLMIPMMACLLVVSIVVGRRVSTTGRYKVAPIVGSAILAVALVLMATIKADTPIYIICIYLGIMGIGLGASMQILTLVAQNSFPLKFVGTATAGQNYFRQVGATLGSAVVGAVFATRLHELVAEKLPGGTGGGGSRLLHPAPGQQPAGAHQDAGDRVLQRGPDPALPVDGAAGRACRDRPVLRQGSSAGHQDRPRDRSWTSAPRRWPSLRRT